MAVSLIGLIVVLAIVLLTAKLQKHYKINIENPTEVELAQIEQTHKTKVISWIESFYEMVFSKHLRTDLPFSLLCPRRKDPSGGLFLE